MNGRGAEVKARVEGKDRGARMRSQGIGSCKELQKFKLPPPFQVSKCISCRQRSRWRTGWFEVKQSCQAAGQAGKVGKEL